MGRHACEDGARAEVRPGRATLAIIVDNAPGVLHRVVGMIAARGFNIETLTVAETDHALRTSRITLTTRADGPVLEQMKSQLERLVCVRSVADVTHDPLGVERELALFKVRGQGPERAEALRVSEIFRARVIDATAESFVFEVTGASGKIDGFEALMRPLGLVEVARTGVLSIRRGAERR